MSDIVEHVAKLFEEQDRKIAKAIELHQADLAGRDAEIERLRAALQFVEAWTTQPGLKQFVRVTLKEAGDD